MKIQVFISFCSADTAVMERLEKAFQPVVLSYAQKGHELFVCQMNKDCAGEWDEWMVEAVKASNVLVCILSDQAMYSDNDKRVLEEVRIARDKCVNVVPFKITEKPLAAPFEAHLGRYSAVWSVTDDQADGIKQESIDEVVRKVCVLLDGQISGEPIRQTESAEFATSGVGTTKNKDFIGRGREMKKLDELFSESNTVVVSGVGGIGKTEFAKEYVRERLDQYTSFCVVDASGGIRNAVSNINFLQTRYVTDEEKRFSENSTLLKKLTEKTIIIFDNYDGIADEDECLFAITDDVKCRFVITSRPTAETLPCLSLEKMDDEDLLSLVYRVFPKIEKCNRLSAEEVRVQLLQLFDFVDGHTMTVEMAAAVMRDGDVPLSQINEKLLFSKEKCRTARSNQRETVIEHLSTLYDMTELNEEQKKILDVMCLVSPVCGFGRRDLRELLELESNEEINALVSKTFLDMDDDNALRMHRLMSDVYYMKRLPSFSDSEFFLDWILENYDITDYENSKLTNEFIGYILDKRVDLFLRVDEEDKENSLLECLMFDSITVTMIVFFSNGKTALNLSKTRLAQMKETVKAMKVDIKSYPLSELLYLTSVVGFVIMSNDISTIKESADRLFAFVQNNSDNDDLADYFSSAVYMLLSAYSGLGEADKIPCLQLFLRSAVENVPEDDEDALVSQFSLLSSEGTVFLTNGEPEKARKMFEQSLEKAAVAYSNPNPVFPAIYLNIANACYQMDDLQEALRMARMALDEETELFGEDVVSMLSYGMHSLLACILGELGDMDAAIPFLKKAVRIYETLNDSQNDDRYALNCNTIATYLMEKKEWKEAFVYNEKSLNAYLRIGDEASAAKAYNNASAILCELEDFRAALSYQNAALDASDKLSLSFRANARIRQGNIKYRLKEFDGTIESYLLAYEDTENSDAQNKYQTLGRICSSLSVVYKIVNQPEKAAEYLALSEEWKKKANPQ